MRPHPVTPLTAAFRPIGLSGFPILFILFILFILSAVIPAFPRIELRAGVYADTDEK